MQWPSVHNNAAPLYREAARFQQAPQKEGRETESVSLRLALFSLFATFASLLDKVFFLRLICA